jgi:glucose/mannose-6-phosphate isomerase
MSELGDWGGAEFVLAADRLDTPDVVEAADPGDMLRQVASSAAQVRTALRACAETDLSDLTSDTRPRAIVVAGMGTSGLAGEILDAVTGLASPVQVMTAQAGRLPGWVGAADVVIAVSCSGSTAETLAMAGEAARRGCRLAGVGPGGSSLHRIAEQARAAFIPVAAAGLPRASLWALAIPQLVIAERLGVTRLGAEVYEQAARRLEEVSHQCRPASESFVNPGKSLALDLVGTLPMVWGTSALSEVAARRFAYQLLQNAKYPAISGVLPEAACHQITAFDGPFAPGARLNQAGHPDATPDDLSGWDPDYDDADPGDAPETAALRLVLIADPDEDPRVGAQRAAVVEVADQRRIGVSELAMDGEHPLIRLAGVIQLADYATVYLAIASGIDPSQALAVADLQTRIE